MPARSGEHSAMKTRQLTFASSSIAMAFAVAMAIAMPPACTPSARQRGLPGASAYADASAEQNAHPKGSLWVFAVGVSQYRNSDNNLEYADNDAVTLTAAFQQLGKGVFDDVKTDVLINQQVTKQSILGQMPAFFAQASSDDTAIVALMGHGATESGTFYFVPYPADLTNLAVEGLPVSDFANAVHQFSGRVAKTVLIVDTCHAGALNFRMRGLDQPAKPRARGVSLVGDLSPRMPNTYILSFEREQRGVVGRRLLQASWRAEGARGLHVRAARRARRRRGRQGRHDQGPGPVQLRHRQGGGKDRQQADPVHASRGDQLSFGACSIPAAGGSGASGR